MATAGRDLSWLDSDFASIRINSHCHAAGTYHQGVTDIGLNGAVYCLKALALIDQKSALAGLNRGSQAGATNEQKTA
jgi:hypothetical protein